MSDLLKIESVDNLHKDRKICIRPYVDPNIKNMGLEKYELSVADGVEHHEQLTVLVDSGVKRYLNGLNEFAPEIKLIEDEEQRAAIVKDIRTVVAQIEREMNANVLDIKDKDFLHNDMAMHYDKSIILYEKLLLNGVVPEQARIILPQSMYTTFIETGNLACYARMYKLRIKKDAQ